MTQDLKVKDLNHLRTLINNREEPLDFYMTLGGFSRSSKYISNGEEKEFCIINQIDESEQELDADELWTDNNIGKAIDQGCFYLYGSQRE